MIADEEGDAATRNEPLFLVAIAGFNVWQQDWDATAQSIQQEADEHEREWPPLGGRRNNSAALP